MTKQHEIWHPLKQTVTPKVSCLYVFDQCILLIFHLSQLSGIFLDQNQHTCLQKLFLTPKNSGKEYLVGWKQIKSTTAALSELQVFGAKTCHICAQLEHVFFLACTRFDATNGIIYLHLILTTYNFLIKQTIYIEDNTSTQFKVRMV